MYSLKNTYGLKASVRVCHPVIEKYRFISGRYLACLPGYEILPDGYFDLAFLFSETGGMSFLAGPYTEKIIVPVKGYDLFIISFRPGKTPAFGDIPPHELMDSMVELSSVYGRSSDGICELLLNAENFQARMDIVEELFFYSRPEPMVKNKIFCRAAEIIGRSSGCTRVEELAGYVGVSVRTLERLFSSILGISPKYFIRLVRFQSAVEKIWCAGHGADYADIAAECGYFDQSHLIRDVRQLSGTTPATLVK